MVTHKKYNCGEKRNKKGTERKKETQKERESAKVINCKEEKEI
jgi:hypothetical protein